MHWTVGVREGFRGERGGFWRHVDLILVAMAPGVWGHRAFGENAQVLYSLIEMPRLPVF